ncbi:MAG: M48 family metalloprotease [Bacteroidota bacterium]
MKTHRITLLFSFLLLLMVTSSCKKDSEESIINVFSVEDDIAFGQAMEAEIAANPQEFPVLDQATYAHAYQHINRIRDSILNTGLLYYEDVFEWKIYIIDNDTMLNAFATPGGYLYFYTGIIKYLDNEAQFAGVLAHEMAHSDLRHSTNQLTKAYGVQILLSILLGQSPGQLTEIIASLAYGLGTLAFSRDHEYQADEYSVNYLYKTSYDARGIADFFIKLDDAPRPPEFLSTHPSPENRIEMINEVWENLGGKEGNTYVDTYNAFKATLP